MPSQLIIVFTPKGGFVFWASIFLSFLMWNLFISLQNSTVCFAKCLQLSLLNSKPPPSSGCWKSFLHLTSVVLIFFFHLQLFILKCLLVSGAAQLFPCSLTNYKFLSLFKLLLSSDNSVLGSFFFQGLRKNLELKLTTS